MNLWLAFVLISFAVMRLVETSKEIVPWPLQPWFKGAYAMVLGILMAAFVVEDDFLLLGLAAGGGSALCHEVQAYLSVRGDEAKTVVIGRAGGGRRVRL